MDTMSMLRSASMVMVFFIVAIWLLTIVWVIKDSAARGVSPAKWGAIALIPFIGAIVYSALRPPMLLTDKQEQEIDFMLRQRELMKYGECGRCSYPVEDDYIMCPNCGAQLKNMCPNCGKPLKPEWNACPWCCTRTPRAAKTGKGRPTNGRHPKQQRQQQKPAAHSNN